jgi:hypothetical protein
MNKRFERKLLYWQWKYQAKHGKFEGPILEYEKNKQKCSDIIYKVLTDEKPCMIARFGNTEFNCIMNYLGVKAGPWKFQDFLSSKQWPFWWLDETGDMMKNLSGFFPNDHNSLARFARLQLQDMKKLDVLGCWIPEEYKLEAQLQNTQKIFLLWLEPFHAAVPWTRALNGKKVLVVHPFAKLIEKQYHEKRRLLFKNPDILPEFDLKTIEAVQSLGGECNGFPTWFDALDHMKEQIDATDYDICIIGCGAYGFSLAAHVKRTGKKGFHLGGVTQLLFGIKGNRWEDPNYAQAVKDLEKGFYCKLFNEHWVKPGNELKPKTAATVEGACYW